MLVNLFRGPRPGAGAARLARDASCKPTLDQNQPNQTKLNQTKLETKPFHSEPKMEYD